MPTFWYMHFCSRPRVKTILKALEALLVALLIRQGVCAAIAASVPVFHTSLRAAREAAAADQGLVMIVFSADWCAPCKLLKSRTLSSREFMEQAGALHVAEIDVEAESSTARAHDVQAVPTLVILTPENKIVSRREGFLETADLLQWLKQSRERVKQGKWEGTVPGPKLTELVAKGAADQLDTNDLVRLVGLLGEPSPADREVAAKLLIEQREQAVLPLIDALTNSYLGIRITANEVLHKVAPDSVSVDPWQAPSELPEVVAALKKWWVATGKLPAQSAEPLPDRSTATSIKGALDSLRGDDPVQRTEAMSMLVGSGRAVLPAVREAIKLYEKAGDQRSVMLLEDVRWAVLIPDDVDQRTGGVRSVLARGKGPERQNAATRLGQAGRAAIPALAELLNDADALVIESAVRALSNLGGKDAIPAMAALLKASDSNLRMTAAQALGHTKNSAAVKELVVVFDDPNEVVACTALSALDEINGDRYSPSKKAQPPEVVQGLKRCLGEPRWRVRAAAAEVTGKLGVNELAGELNFLLSDPDGFVVKNALEALQKLGAAPEPQNLLSVAKQHPELRGETVELLVNRGTEDAVKTVTELYQSSAIDGRIAIIRNLGTGKQQAEVDSPWQPLLGQAATETDPRLRRAAAQMLASQPLKVAAMLVGPLLSDEDEETRGAAAGVILSIIGRERQVVATSHGTSFSEFVSVDETENSPGTARKKASATNEPPATTEQIASWHAALQQRAALTSDLLTAAAIYVTGSSNADLTGLRAAVDRADKAGLDQLSKSAAMPAIIPRLPWPEGKPIAEKFSTSPSLFLKMTAYTQQGSSGFNDFLFEPERFRAAVDPATPDEVGSSLQRLLGSQQKGWSLFSSNPRTEAVVKALLDATNAAWRSAAVYSLGFRDDPKAQDYLQHALADSNGWVRVAAVSGLTRGAKDRPTLERLLGPLLADSNKKVAEMATIGLLEPETRSAAGLEYSSGYFEFEKVHVWSSFYEPNSDQRPLATLQGNPPFLETARQKLASTAAEDAALQVLLLAQYGDFTGLERLIKGAQTESQSESEGIMLTAVGLSRDSNYLPYVKKMVASAKDEQDFRRLLQALRGMTGAEARELRLEINKRMRQGRA
jgi:HEAT repeat protein